MITTAVFSSARFFIFLEISNLCFISKYDVTSSKIYKFAFFKKVAAIAIFCNSPPDNCCTFLSRIFFISKLEHISLNLFFSSDAFNKSETFPLNWRGMKSTCWGLYAVFIFPAFIISRNSCISVPLK